jgi:hypothetical protein
MNTKPCPGCVGAGVNAGAPQSLCYVCKGSGVIALGDEVTYKNVDLNQYRGNVVEFRPDGKCVVEWTVGSVSPRMSKRSVVPLADLTRP